MESPGQPGDSLGLEIKDLDGVGTMYEDDLETSCSL